MEGELVEFDGLEVVYDGEDIFFYFIGVFSIEDDYFYLFEVDFDGSGGSYVSCELVGRELISVVDDEIRFVEVFEFFRSWLNEYVVLGIELENGLGNG